MESSLLGLVLDSSVPIAAERRKLTPDQVIQTVRGTVGEIPIVLCSLTQRRAFLDELKATVPIHPVTEATAEIVARVGGEQAVKGIILPLGDLIIGACALELSYAIGTNGPRL